MDDMLQVVWDHDPEAVIDAFKVEIIGLRTKLEKAERNADQFKFEIEQDGYLRAAEVSSAALLNALNAVLDPDNIATIAREKSTILAMKFVLNAMNLPSDTARITQCRKFVQAIWRVRDDAKDEMREVYYSQKEQ